MIQADLQLRANHLRSGRTPYVLATVVRAERPTSAKAGDSALLLPDGTLEGFVGGTCAESTVRLEGLRLLKTGESTLLRITPAADEREVVGDGLVTVGNPCLSGGTLEIFLEAMIPPTLVQVFGDAPIARALGRVGEALGYEIRAIGNPDEPFPPDTAAVVVASHGRNEEQVLTAAVRGGVPYVALVASRRRGQAVVAGLELSQDEKARVHTPAGLDIGARAAPEIALSVLAEIIANRPRPARQASVPSALPTEAVDPVCGMTVAVTGESLRLELDGKVWHFCGPGCRQAFADDPGRYLDE